MKATQGQIWRRRVLGRPVGWLEVADAVIRAAAGRWGAAAGPADQEAMLEGARAGGALFRSPAWTWDASDPDAAASPC